VTRDPDWLSWPEAAELVGCRVPTIDWNARQGRIERRPSKGSRPSLKRESVEEFAVWWAQRQAVKEKKKADAERRSRNWADPPEPTGWLSTKEAAAALNVTRKHVQWLIAQGYLKAVKTGRRWWVEEASVRGRAEEHEREAAQWVAHIEAARIVGCSQQTILRAVKDGRILKREVQRSSPSLSRASVIAFASDW